MKKSPFVIIAILGACLLSAHTNAASFDCAKANIWVEKAICSNAKLSELDEAMAQQYKSELATASDYEDSDAYKIITRNEQRQWLKFRRNTCKSEKCLIREYKERIGERDGSYANDLARSELPTKQAFGGFYEDAKIAIYNPQTRAWDKAESVTNSISIHKVDNKPYASVIDGDLIFTNGHTCSIDSEVTTWSENHWSIIDYHYNGAELRLYPVSDKGKTQLLLSDIDKNNRYSSYHCGARGYFDGKVLESR